MTSQVSGVKGRLGLVCCHGLGYGTVFLYCIDQWLPNLLAQDPKEKLDICVSVLTVSTVATRVYPFRLLLLSAVLLSVF